jgi:hypothetical protein
MKEFHSLIEFMSASKNLSEFKHEQHKATGNFNDIIADLIKNCIFLIELDSEKHVFQLTAKVLESKTGSGNYNEEDLKDYFTKARILINEAKKSAADDEKLKDFGVNDLVSISMALESHSEKPGRPLRNWADQQELPVPTHRELDQGWKPRFCDNRQEHQARVPCKNW